MCRFVALLQAQPASAADLMLMRRIDEPHLEHPSAGARMLRDMLNNEGRRVARKHVATLMQRMDIEGLIARRTRPTTSGTSDVCVSAAKCYLDRPNQAWAM